jgi:3',5'-cyclic AMP phosphodiesterase CpdA
VLITGDLVDGGTLAEYELLRDVLAPLDARYVLLTGNHDEPDVLRSVFTDAAIPPARPAHFVVDDLPVRLVAVDTTIAGRHDGELTDDELAWLDRTLGGAPERPTIVAMHHPPFVTGMWWMDYGGLDAAPTMRSIVDRHPQVAAVLSGHVHRAIHTTWGSTLVATAPAVTYQSCLALETGGAPLVTDVVAPIPLLWWDGQTMLAGHTDYRLPQRLLDLSTVIPDWDTYQAACRAGGPMPKDH